MKEMLRSSDGSVNYGNGVWGPSTADIQHADLSFNEKPRRKEEPDDLLLISQESVVGNFFQKLLPKVKLPAKFAIPVGLAVTVVAVACGSKNSEELNPTISGNVTERKVETQLDKGWNRFTSFTLPYQIGYPSNWRVDKNVVSVEFYDKLYIIANEVNPTKFKVDSEPVASWITIDDYKNELTQSIKHDAIIHRANALVTETPNQSIDGQKAWKLETYVTSSVATPNHSVVYLTIRDGRAWTILFEADESKFNQNLPTFEKMLASFKFLK